MSLLNQLSSTTSKSKKRLGRGTGSGKGNHTVGRGQKGYKSRVGSKVPLWFEGGQLPLVKRLPMQRGKGRFNVVRPTAEVTLSDLHKMKSDVITLETLKLERVIATAFKKAKIIATGTLDRKVAVNGVGVSENARALIIKAGGSVE